MVKQVIGELVSCGGDRLSGRERVFVLEQCDVLFVTLADAFAAHQVEDDLDFGAVV